MDIFSDTITCKIYVSAVVSRNHIAMNVHSM